MNRKNIIFKFPRDSYYSSCAEYLNGGYLVSHDEDLRPYTFQEYINELNHSYHSWNKLEVVNISLGEFECEIKKSYSSRVNLNRYVYLVSSEMWDYQADSLVHWVKTGRLQNKNGQDVLFGHIHFTMVG